MQDKKDNTIEYVNPSKDDKLSVLYPPIDAYDTGFLKVSTIHTIYYEQSGNPNGKPALICHGGPGCGTADVFRQYFDPSVYRIIGFDQRGCTRSTPHAETKENTTWDLVEDMEKIREHLKVDKWVIFGGSWGSTLALAYAEKHTERVKALILRGIFTLRRSELQFFYQEGANWIFPDAFDEFMAPIPKAERGDLMGAYYRRFHGKDKEECLKCATVWTKYELSTCNLITNPNHIAKADDPELALQFAKIENHYFVNAGFFEEDGQLIKRASILNNIPGTIINGRYDVVCPIKSAWDLKKEWNTAKLKIIGNAGHSCFEEYTLSELVNAVNSYKDL